PSLSRRIDRLRSTVDVEQARQLPTRVVPDFIPVRLPVAMLLDDHPAVFGDVLDVGVIVGELRLTSRLEASFQSDVGVGVFPARDALRFITTFLRFESRERRGDKDGDERGKEPEDTRFE